MGIPIPVGGTLNPGAVKISAGASAPYLLTVEDNSPNSVYIGLDPTVSDLSYAKRLTPGDSIQWTDINSEIWAYCKPNESAQVTVAYEAAGAFSPGRPAVYAKTAMSLIKTITVPVGVFNSATDIEIPDIYQTLYIVASGDIGPLNPVPLNGVFLSWKTPEGYQSLTDLAYFARAGNIQWTVPKKSNSLNVSLTLPSGLGALVYVFATSQALPEDYVSDPNPAGGGLFIGGVATVNGFNGDGKGFGFDLNTLVGVSNIFFKSWSGNIFQFWQSPALGGGPVLRPAGTNTYRRMFVTPAAATTENRMLNFPNSPMEIEINSGVNGRFLCSWTRE